MANDLIVVKVDRARQLLSEASSAQDAKKVADMAKAAEVYARRQKLGEESIRYATAVMTDAMTLLGEFLKAADPKGAATARKSPNGTFGGRDRVIPDGISKKESSDAQALADLKAVAPDLHEAVRNGETTVSRARSEKKRRDKRAAEAVPVEVTEADGSLYRVDHSDCLAWFSAQPTDAFNLVFGSPPYEQARLYLEDGEDKGIARDTAAWVAWMADVTEAALRCCTGLVAFVVAGQTKNYAWTASPALLMAELVRRSVVLRCPPIYRRVGIPGSGGPDWLRNDYEFVVCATRGGQLPWSDNTAMGHEPKFEPGGDPSHRQQNGTRVNDPVAYATPEERGNHGSHRARRRKGRIYHPPERCNPGNVIDCGAVGGGNMGDHACHENEAPFPESLAEFFIRSFCPPGGLVADPFSGSGTTGTMAVRLGRRFHGCDLRESQVRLSRRRMANAQPPLPMEA